MWLSWMKPMRSIRMPLEENGRFVQVESANLEACGNQASTDINNERPPTVEGLDNEAVFKLLERYLCIQVERSMTVPEYHKNSW